MKEIAPGASGAASARRPASEDLSTRWAARASENPLRNVMHVQTSAMPKDGCMASGRKPNGAVRRRNSSTTGSVICSPALITYTSDDRSNWRPGARDSASQTSLKPKLGDQE